MHQKRPSISLLSDRDCKRQPDATLGSFLAAQNQERNKFVKPTDKKQTNKKKEGKKKPGSREKKMSAILK